MMNEGSSLEEMSNAIGISISQLSRYRQTMFEVRYVPKKGTEQYMTEYASIDKLRFEQKTKTILKFVEGAK
jgi:DNA-binding IclR family transcriptional regulator